MLVKNKKSAFWAAILSLSFEQVKNFIKNQLMAVESPDRIILSSIKNFSPAIIKTNDFIEKSQRKY